MEAFLKWHKPSSKALRQAQAEGIDLELLKVSNSVEYKMRVAQEILVTSEKFVEIASQVFFAAFPYHEMFKLEHGSTVRLLSFPELSTKELRRWDDALGRMALQPQFSQQLAYYRVIEDQQGQVRQLAFPLKPQDWQGQTNVLVGPFEDQQQAKMWGEGHSGNQQLMIDTIAYAEHWFCDVFLAEL